MKRAFSNWPLMVNRYRKTYDYATLDEAAVAAIEAAQFTLQQADAGIPPEGYSVSDPNWYPAVFLRSALSVLQVDAEMDLHGGNAVHLFLPSVEFIKWLISCAMDTPSDEVVSSLDTLFARNVAAGTPHMFDSPVGVIHYPVGFRTRSTLLIPRSVLRQHETYMALSEMADAVKNAHFLIIGRNDVGSYKGMFFNPNSAGSLSDVEGNAGVLDGTLPDIEMARLIVGLALYVAAFPDMMMPGLPDDLANPGHYTGARSFKVGVADAIRNTGTHSSPTAHYRMGHFRVLSSERFTTKRFQTIFVRGTFVKGHAVTVLSPEDGQSQQAPAP